MYFSHTKVLCEYSTNRMWFSVVCTLIDHGTRHHSGRNVVAE